MTDSRFTTNPPVYRREPSPDETVVTGLTAAVPEAFEAGGVFMKADNTPAVALRFIVPPDHPVYKEPIVILIPEHLIEKFIQTVRTGAAMIPEVCKREAQA